MLKIRLILVGKDKDAWVADGIAHYRKLLSRFASLDIVTLPGVKAASSLSPSEIMAKEHDQIVRKLGKGFTVALADSGKKMDSMSFSKWLSKVQVSGSGELTFVVGGAYGLDKRLLDSADLILSLSPLTFSHQLVRLVLLEQLYRGFSILHGTDYHK